MADQKEKDLTQGPIPGQLIRLATPIIVGMGVFTLYLLTDLYFVGRLGPGAVAAVAVSGNAFFMALGLAHILSTGTATLTAQAKGRGDRGAAGLVLRQSLMLAVAVGGVAALGGWLGADAYMRFFGLTGESLVWGSGYFRLFALTFLIMILQQVITACLQGLGDTKTPMKIRLQAVALNIALDPVLIFGLGGIPAMGVKGAALATVLAQGYALVRYLHLIVIKKYPFDLSGRWLISLPTIKRSLAIGIPSGVTFFLLALNMLITYRVVGPFGTAALAAIGVGFRILQTLYIPVVALSTAIAAMTGQNYGARKAQRIRETRTAGTLMAVGFMVFGTIVCWGFTRPLISFFNSDPMVIRFGVDYLRVIALTNVAVGFIMAFSATFQGLGKTYPSLIAALIDNGLYALLVFSLPALFGWGIGAIWWLKACATLAETTVVVLWLRHELSRMEESLETSPD